MGLTVAELTADLGLNAAPLQSGLAGVMGKFGGLSTIAVAGGAAIAAGLAVGTKALFDVGESFDEAFDTIRVGTGATGDALEGLKGDFKAVFAEVPTDMASAGTAIADLNTRLGLTGKPLQDLAAQFLDLSRITGTDLATNISHVTRVFGDWKISADQQAGSLDAMFRAAQASGIGFDDLTSSVVKFGAPLRNLGFGFEDSLALLSQFDKAGVNTQTVFGGLRQGIGKLAKDGEAVPETFRRVVDSIEKMGPGTEATALAIELFGARSGPDLADAIASGKFAIDDMFAAITEGEDTIRGAARDTDDWRESLTRLKNKALVALEPIATGLFNAVGWLADAMVDLTENEDVQEFFGEVAKTARELVAVFAQMVAPIRENWDTIKAVIGTALRIVADVIRAAMAAIRGDWGAAWGHLRSALSTAWEAMKGVVSRGVSAIGSYIRSIPGKVKGWLGNLGSLLVGAGQSLIQGLISGITSKLGDLWGTVSGIAGGIKSRKGPLDKDAVLLRPAGRAIIGGLMQGIDEQLGPLYRQVSGIAPRLAVVAPGGSLGLPGLPTLAGAGSAGNGPVEVHEHYHVHTPGGTTLVGSAETVARLLAPALSRQSGTARKQRARRR